MKCRHCGTPLIHTFLDLGYAPPSNAYLSLDDLHHPEIYYPLKIKVCTECWLVQTEDYAQADDLFRNDYAYFSSTSTSWLTHAADYSKKITTKLGLSPTSMVVEVASNDGYLLKNFLADGIPCLGIEPTASTANAATGIGIPVLHEFFGQKLAERLARENLQADLIIGNNVYAHIPNINDFTQGLKTLLKPAGTITLEFPHLLELIEKIQFDTVYHEHFSYFSLGTVKRILAASGLRVYDVERLPTHGGSLRIYACHTEYSLPTSESIEFILTEERVRGLQSLTGYQGFQALADSVKDDLITFLIDQRRAGRTVAGYGAAAKGSTLLNYAGIKPDLLPFIFDAAPSKQGMFMPGSHIPILPPAGLAETRPNFLLILPWNIKTEVCSQNQHLIAHGTQFVTAIPKLEVL